MQDRPMKERADRIRNLLAENSQNSFFDGIVVITEVGNTLAIAISGHEIFSSVDSESHSNFMSSSLAIKTDTDEWVSRTTIVSGDHIIVQTTRADFPEQAVVDAIIMS